MTNVTFQGRTLKLKTFVLKIAENLFSIDWMEKFKLWDMPINSFYQKLENLITDAKNLIKDLKEIFPEVFFWGLWSVNKMTAKFELNSNNQPVFKKKRKVPFASLPQINEELD